MDMLPGYGKGGPVIQPMNSRFQPTKGFNNQSSLFNNYQFNQGMGRFNKNKWKKGKKGNKKAIMNELAMRTKFSRKDLEQLYREFHKAAKNGMLDKMRFAKGLQSLGQGVDEQMVEQLFAAFDYDKDGLLDFKDFAAGLSVMYNGTMDERLRLAFNVRQFFLTYLFCCRWSFMRTP